MIAYISKFDSEYCRLMSNKINNKSRILLLSGYDAASHKQWRNILVAGLTQFEWTEIALPDRYFFWRIRGNGLTFAYQHRQVLEREYDCLIVTSMVDLTTLRGFVPHLANIPTILYFHENQFEYPVAPMLPNQNDHNGDSKNIINAQLTSIYALLCADQTLFNSRYNQQTFFDGARKLLKMLPDGIPKDLLKDREVFTQVMPVPVSINSFLAKSNVKTCNDSVEIVWNHRWEYDKQPEVFFDALKLFKQAGFKFKVHVVGQSFRQKPECFVYAEEYFSDEILTWGYQSRTDYLNILSTADIVVSSANHDFQGLSMLEAIASGCVPVAPNRVAYPEYVEQDNLYQVGEQVDEARSLFKKLTQVFDRLQNPNEAENSRKSQQQKIKGYLDEHLLIKYAQVISSTIQRFKKTPC